MKKKKVKKVRTVNAWVVVRFKAEGSKMHSVGIIPLNSSEILDISPETEILAVQI